MHQLRNTQSTSTSAWAVLLSEFWLWWSSELAMLVPEWMKPSGPKSRGSIAIEFRDDSIFMVRSVKSKPETNASFTLEDEQALIDGSLYEPGDSARLIIADGLYLRRRISLPQAAEENLQGVLEFEMDRHTPFQAAQVYFDFHIVSRSAASQQIIVELIVAPRPAIDTMIAKLSSANIQISKVTISEEKGLHSINLMEHGRENQSRITFNTRLNKFQLRVITITLVLAIATVLIPIWQKRSALLTLQPTVEQLGGKATSIQSSRRELEKIVTEHNFLIEKKSLRPPAIAVLEELSRLLPDNTWVHHVAIIGNEVEVVGETSSSADVIRLIEQSDLFFDANFQSPLVKNKFDKERFNLSATLTSTVPSTLSSVAATEGAAN